MSEDEILADVLDAIIPAYLTQGPDGYPAEMFEGMLALKPGTEYYVYAIGYDAEKEEPTSELQMYKFSTTAPTGEAPDLTFGPCRRCRRKQHFDDDLLHCRVGGRRIRQDGVSSEANRG